MNDITMDPSGWCAAAQALQPDTEALRRAIHAIAERFLAAGFGV